MRRLLRSAVQYLGHVLDVLRGIAADQAETNRLLALQIRILAEPDEDKKKDIAGGV